MDVVDFLRLHEEPCRFYSEREIHHVLSENVGAFMEFLERFYRDWAKTDALIDQPMKQVFTTNRLRGDLRVMPCIINDADGVVIKVVKVIGTNEEERVVSDKICVGRALLINPTDNFVEGIFDVCALSSFRTAALAVLAYKHTALSSEVPIGLIGAGRIGYYTALILNKWLGTSSFSVFDSNPATIEIFAKVTEDWATLHDRTLRDLCASCSAIFLATTSNVPVLANGAAEEAAFIASVGADADNLSELDASLLNDRQIVSESRQNLQFGDLRRWYERGLIDDNGIIELRHVIDSQKSPRPTIFVSTGTAVQDALACQFVKDRAEPRTW